MDDSTFRPQLDKAEWHRTRKLRNFGQYELSKFPSSDITSIGDKCIDGKVEVDCRFRLDESKWGLLMDAGRPRPAGIIHMDLAFYQTQGYKLKWATVKVTLDGKHEGLQKYRDESIKDTDDSIFISKRGPHKMIGDPIAISKKRTTQVIPNISAQGVSVSGMGVENETSWDNKAFWTFKGFIPPRHSKSSGVTYDSLIWRLEETNFEKQHSHPDEFKTAFAFTNSGQPFLMKVEIEGKLSNITDRIVGGFKKGFKFSSRLHREENISTTLVRGFAGKQQYLDEVAKNLDDEMTAKNGKGAYSETTISPDKPTLSNEESQPALKASTERKAASSGANVQGKTVTEQALKDMINTHLIPPVHNGNDSREEEKSPQTVVEEMGVTAKQREMEIDLETKKTLLKMILLHLRQGWLWLMILPVWTSAAIVVGRELMKPKTGTITD